MLWCRTWQISWRTPLTSPGKATEYDVLMRRSTVVSQNNKIGVKRQKIRKSLGFANATNKVLVVKIGIMM